ncbi:alanine racemase [Candidatus Caldatribacterium sp.]|uniref:alanine racemase n=1 Tax=Candidatus Caldatribacterium sp. TaxID=2282143 RepID=UPI0038738ED8
MLFQMAPLYPCLEVDLDILEENACRLLEKCHSWGVSPVVVTKGFLADSILARALRDFGFSKFADSNLANLVKLRSLFGPHVDLFLIRLPMLEELDVLAVYGILPFVSHVEILERLSSIAQELGKRQPVVLVLEGGDGREGMLFEEVPEVASFLKRLPGVSVYGVATTLACLSGVLPNCSVLEQLTQIKEFLQGVLGKRIVLSVGGTTFLALWEEGCPPWKVDEIRFGEALLFGSDISRKRDIPWLKQGAFTIAAEVVEVRTKEPSKESTLGYDAFGGKPFRNFSGPRKRVLLAIGKQDIDENQLYFDDAHVTIVGATSNYLVLDVEESTRTYRVGDVVSFRAGYGAVLRAFLSPYVAKVYRRKKVCEGGR